MTTIKINGNVIIEDRRNDRYTVRNESQSTISMTIGQVTLQIPPGQERTLLHHRKPVLVSRPDGKTLYPAP